MDRHDEALERIWYIRRRIHALRNYFGFNKSRKVVKEESPEVDEQEVKNAEMNALREKLRKKT